MLYNFGSAIMRATGDTRRPLYYLIDALILRSPGILPSERNRRLVECIHCHIDKPFYIRRRGIPRNRYRTGDTRRPLYYLSLAGAINVVLNLIFVIVLHMDVAGVAAATVISQCISAVLIVRCMVMEEGSIHLDLSGLKVNGDKFKKIIQIGLPASFQGMVFSFSNVIIQSSVRKAKEKVSQKIDQR